MSEDNLWASQSRPAPSGWAAWQKRTLPSSSFHFLKKEKDRENLNLRSMTTGREALAFSFIF